ncbi:MAG: hypothetical protein KIT33_01650 [Candidatus Kapabacteria bacterium]|nr:hypothetical protein [Ignavibacteriota bacterium]MCW5883655.1 hypothetical protein [Candidatus Kapabacteria bacterium]
MNKSALIIIGIILISNSAFSNPYSEYILKGAVNLNGNLYSSDFNQIGGYKNCCPKYESAFGIAPSIYLGGEIRNVFNLFGYDINYSLMLGYNDLSAAYSINQYIGNDLGVDSYERILVDHMLDITYPLLNTEHSFWFNPSNKLPLGVKLGFNVGIPLSKEFFQREVLLSPQDVTFPDGTRDFNSARADIPESSAIFAALSIGGRYPVYKFSDYEVFANASFNYGLTQLASNLDLNINQVTLGIALHYNIKKPEPPRPLAPPAPEPPAPQPPPLARKPEMKLLTDFDYNKVNSGDTLKVTINKFEYITYASLMPVLIFERNSTKTVPIGSISNKLSDLYDGNFKSYEKLDFPNNYPKIIAEHISFYPDTKFKIVAQTEDEDIAILKKRLDIVSKNLTDAGIANKLFTTETRTIKNQKHNNEYLTEEARKVYFDFSTDGGMIEVKVSSEELMYNFNKVMAITPIFFAEDTASFKGTTILNGENETSLTMGTNQFVFSSGMFVSPQNKPNTFEISAEVKDSEGNVAVAKSAFYLTHDEKLIRSYINLNKSDKNAEIEEFILGYTTFDKADFYLVNSFALDYIRSKSFEGRIIEIIPLTDNIGTDDYNRNLALKRAAEARKLIANPNGRFEVVFPESEIFSNDTPYGRMMNRSVIIRIR